MSSNIEYVEKFEAELGDVARLPSMHGDLGSIFDAKRKMYLKVLRFSLLGP